MVANTGAVGIPMYGMEKIKRKISPVTLTIQKLEKAKPKVEKTPTLYLSKL